MPVSVPATKRREASSGSGVGAERDADGVVSLLVDDLQKPNGIVITPDDQWIYVSDRGSQKLHRYRINAAKQLVDDKVIYDFSPDRGIDGMWLDEDGNIYGAAGDGKTTGLFVIRPQRQSFCCTSRCRNSQRT